MNERLRQVKKLVTPILASAIGMASCVGIATAEQRASKKVGYDVSYPQCGGNLPRNRSFALVGINGGYANNYNPCLAPEYKWAKGSSGNTTQPKAQLYLWAESPGVNYHGTPIADWPKSGTNKFGDCHHDDSKACSFQYGKNKGSNDLIRASKVLKIGESDLGIIWIDVDADTGPSSSGTWQSSNANNLATIEGFAAAVKAGGDKPGFYSDRLQWGETVGNLTYRPFVNDPEWVPGGGTVKGAQEDCKAPFIKGAHVAIAQYVQGPPPATTMSRFDLNWAC